MGRGFAAMGLVLLAVGLGFAHNGGDRGLLSFFFFFWGVEC